jgi:hypothetical protein
MAPNTDVVPTMITGIYDMNFTFMPELTTPFGYPVVMLIIIGSCGFLYRHSSAAAGCEAVLLSPHFNATAKRNLL